MVISISRINLFLPTGSSNVQSFIDWWQSLHLFTSYAQLQVGNKIIIDSDVCLEKEKGLGTSGFAFRFVLLRVVVVTSLVYFLCLATSQEEDDRKKMIIDYDISVEKEKIWIYFPFFTFVGYRSIWSDTQLSTLGSEVLLFGL